MSEFIATFHTHCDAIVSNRALLGAGLNARMMPVPRKLSSSCGTCVRYEAQSDSRNLLEDFEAIYSVADGNKYSLIVKEEELQ